jgi:hypothetical protein
MAERRYEQETERLNAALASLVPSEPVSTAQRKLYWPTGTSGRAQPCASGPQECTPSSSPTPRAEVPRVSVRTFRARPLGLLEVLCTTPDQRRTGRLMVETRMQDQRLEAEPDRLLTPDAALARFGTRRQWLREHAALRAYLAVSCMLSCTSRLCPLALPILRNQAA